MSTNLARWLSPLLLLAVAAPTAPSAGEDPKQNAAPPAVAFDKFGQEFVAAHCPKGATAKNCGVDAILDRDFARLQLGAFDIAYPAAFLEDKVKAEDFKAVVT